MRTTQHCGNEHSLRKKTSDRSGGEHPCLGKRRALLEQKKGHFEHHVSRSWREAP